MNKNFLEFKSKSYCSFGDTEVYTQCWLRLWPAIKSNEYTSEEKAIKDLKDKIDSRIKELETEALILKELMK